MSSTGPMSAARRRRSRSTEVPGYIKQTRPGPRDASRSVDFQERHNGHGGSSARRPPASTSPGSRRAATVPLDPAMAAIDGFRLVLATLADGDHRELAGQLSIRLDPEFLHDLRIAVRRTRTVLHEAKACFPPQSSNRPETGSNGSPTSPGTPHDLDVYLLEWPRYTDPPRRRGVPGRSNRCGTSSNDAAPTGTSILNAPFAPHAQRS